MIVQMLLLNATRKRTSLSIQFHVRHIASCLFHVTIYVFLVNNKRVFLTPSVLAGSDYINASFIDVSELPIDSLVM